MKKLLLSIAFFSGFGWLTSTAVACAYDPGEHRYHVTFFNPELIGDTTYRSYYLDADLYYTWENSDYNEYHANLVEWQQYVGTNNVISPLSAIQSAIYSLSAEEYDKMILTPLAEKKTPKLDNDFLKQLWQQSNIDALQYIGFAKRVEENTDFGGWENEEDEDLNSDHNTPSLKEKELLQEALRRHEQTQSEWLKLRYAYQVVKIAFQIGLGSECLQYYNQLVIPLVAKQPLLRKSIAYYRATADMAGAKYRLGQYGEAAYTYALIFAQTKDRRDEMLRNFDAVLASSENAFDEALQLAQKTEEKALLWALKGRTDRLYDAYSEEDEEPMAYNPSDLQNAFKADPQSIYPELLLIRKINELERWYLSPKMTQDVEVEGAVRALRWVNTSNQPQAAGIGNTLLDIFRSFWQWLKNLFGSNAQEDLAIGGKLETEAYLETLKKIALDAANHAETRQPNLWRTAAAYFAYMQEKYEEAQTLAMKVAKPVIEPAISHQAGIIAGLAALETRQPLDAQQEQLWFENLAAMPIPEPMLYSNDEYTPVLRTYTRLAQVYAQQNEIGKAALCFKIAGNNLATAALLDIYAMPEDLKSLQTLLTKANPTPWEKFLVSHAAIDHHTLTDIMATRLMRRYQFDEAYALLETLPASYWQAIKNPPPPAEEWMDTEYEYDNFPTTFAQPLPIGQLADTKMTKLEFARQVVAFEKQAAEQSPKADIAYWTLGNGFFNTPFWGYNNALWQGQLANAMSYYYDFGAGLYPLNIPKFAEALQYKFDNFLDEYGYRKKAADYYQKAAQVTKDSELGAKAAYYAYLAEETPFASFVEGTQNASLIKLLTTKYSRTKFFDELKATCPGIEEYLR